MPTDDTRQLLLDATAGPVAPLDHDRLRRRARRRTGTRRLAAAATALVTIVGAGLVVTDLARAPAIDIAASPSAAEDPAPTLSGLPELPARLALPEDGEVAAVHLGRRPVFVVDLGDGEVVVVDAVSPHRADTERAKVLAFCREPWTFRPVDGGTVLDTPGTFADLWHGSRMAMDGAWLAGPAPTGLPRYEVLAVGDDTVEVGQPGVAPDRSVDPFREQLGGSVEGRPVGDGRQSCVDQFDQLVGHEPPVDETAVLWHEPEHPDMWAYPFTPVDEPSVATEDGEPLFPVDHGPSGPQQEGSAVDALVVIVAFVAVLTAVAVRLRRREEDGSLDAGPSPVSRPGLRRLFDFGSDGWSEDGRNQPPDG